MDTQRDMRQLQAHVGCGRRPVDRGVEVDPSFWSRPAGPRHRSHGIQGQLALALARHDGRRRDRAERRRADRAVAVRARRRRAGRAHRARRTSATRERVLQARRGGAAGGRPPSGRAAPRAPLVRRSARDVRGQRHGRGQRARRRACGGAACASSSTSRRTSATRTASGSGPTARTSRWAATIPTRAPRAPPSW